MAGLLKVSRHAWVLACLALLLAWPLSASAQEYRFSTNNNGTLRITTYLGNEDFITVPSAMYGLPVTEIASFAYFCASMTNVHIPASIATIEAGAFNGCSLLTTISVDIGNTNYCSVGGILFNKSQSLLLKYPPRLTGRYTIPSSVVTIAYGAFNNCNLTNVTLGNAVQSVGDWAFAYSYSLSSITLNNNLKSIGSNAFYQCYSLASIGIPNQVTNIGAQAFAECSELAWLWIGNGVKTIGDSAFNTCAKLTAANLPEGLTSIGTSVFENCRLLGEITVPDSATNIAYRAFFRCSKLGRIHLGNGVVSLGITAFAECSSLTNLVLGNSLKTIDTAAFYGCQKLPNVNIPDSVITIGMAAFDFCPSLTGVNLSSNLTTIGAAAFRGCGLTNVIVPDSVAVLGGGATFTGTGAFLGCAKLTNISLGAGITNIENGLHDDDYLAFIGCSALMTIQVDPENAVYSSRDGVLFDKNKTKLICYPRGKVGNYEVPDTVASILGWSFEYCNALTNLIIPETVKELGDCVFIGCSNLSKVYFKSDAPIIGACLFTNVTDVTIYYLPGSTGWERFAGLRKVFWQLPNPTILDFSSTFGIRKNRFGFTISWATNTSVVIEATTNISQGTWLPLTTNALNQGSVYFSDPVWTNSPGRFYRVRVP